MPTSLSEGGWAGTDQSNFLFLGWEIDKTKVGQRYEDVESKREYYHIIIFPEKTWNFTSRTRHQHDDSMKKDG